MSLGRRLDQQGIVLPERFRVREICWIGTEEGVGPPIVFKALLVAIAPGEEQGGFISGLRDALNELGSRYRPFVLPWSTKHSPACDREGGGGCLRCEARDVLNDMRSRATRAFGALDAYHEAGHAVIGFSLGMEIEEVTLIPYGSGWGWTVPQHCEKLGDVSFLQQQPRLAKAYAVCLLAGPMSQARYSGRSTDELASFGREDMAALGGTQDLRAWDRVSRALQLDDGWWEYCRSEVLQRFENPQIRFALDLLAKQLQQGKHFQRGALTTYLAATGCPIIPKE